MEKKEIVCCMKKKFCCCVFKVTNMCVKMSSTFAVFISIRGINCYVIFLLIFLAISFGRKVI